jgi:hypothetical protein
MLNPVDRQTSFGSRLLPLGVLFGPGQEPRQNSDLLQLFLARLTRPSSQIKRQKIGEDRSLNHHLAIGQEGPDAGDHPAYFLNNLVGHLLQTPHLYG